jgi:hypothetical protein
MEANVLMAGITFHIGTGMTDLTDESLKILFQQHGIFPPFSTERIRAGRNSDVYKICNSQGKWILKNYFQQSSDKRDRLRTEFQFLSYLNNVGTIKVARPIGMDATIHSALYTYIPGTRPVNISPAHIRQAAQFIKTINLCRDTPVALALPLAADACLSWQAHMELTASRIDRLLAVQPNMPLEMEAVNFVRQHLLPLWLHLKASLLQELGSLQMEFLLQEENRIISTSDFGFHNVLENNGELFFLDFEYAGWDDPAKLICDFICQPELPVTQSQGQQFRDELLSDIQHSDAINERVELLLPVHRLKWCCILLNEFRLEDRNRRLHAGVNSDGMLEDQLAKAKCYFNEHLAALH